MTEGQKPSLKHTYEVMICSVFWKRALGISTTCFVDKTVFLHMVMHKLCIPAEINWMIKAAAPGCVCVCVCTAPCKPCPSPCLCISAKNQHNFPSFMRLQQTIWDLLNPCGVFAHPCWIKSACIRMLGICSNSLWANIASYSRLHFVPPFLKHSTLTCKIRLSLEFFQWKPVRFWALSFTACESLPSFFSSPRPFVPYFWQSATRFLIFHSFLFCCIPPKSSQAWWINDQNVNNTNCFRKSALGLLDLMSRLKL